MRTLATIVLSVVVFVVLSVIVTFVWRVAAPTYKAAVLLHVEFPGCTLGAAPEESAWSRAKAFFLSVGDGGGRGPAAWESVVRSHATGVRSRETLMIAAADPRIRNTRWFQSSPDSAVERLADAISVKHWRETPYITVSMTGVARKPEDRSDLAQVVNAVADTYVAYSSDMDAISQTSRISRLRVERDKLQRDLESVRRTAELVRREVSVPGPQNHPTALEMELRALVEQMVQLGGIKAQADSAMKSVLEREADGTISNAPEVAQAVERDYRVRLLREKEIDLAIRRDDPARESGDKGESVKEVDTNLTTVRTLIAEREKKLTLRTIARMKNEREAAVVSVTARLLEFQQRFNEAIARVRDLEATRTKLRQLAMREEGLLETVNKINNRLLELRLRSDLREVDVRIKAIPPVEISLPRWGTMLPLGGAAGLVFGGLVAILRLARRARLRSARSEAEVSPTPSPAPSDAIPTSPSDE